MFDSTNSLSALGSLNSLDLLENKSNSSSTTGLEDTFQELLAASMLSGMSSSSESGMDTSSLLMPIMLSLIEQLISKQMEQGDKTAASNGNDNTVSYTNQASTARSGTANQPQGRPVGGRLTQGYHGTHYALDFGVPVGTQVKATMDGKVTYAGWNNEGYGNLVIVQNGAYKTYYAHLSEIPVHIGDQVSAGSTVGLSGNTGNSTGPHVHYEVRYQNNHIDPTSFTL
jgi:murein DD-endopeptidase MepM/ murein hydrolase activator NlpD